MINLLLNGEYLLFSLLILVLALSLSCHEFGHALVAKWCGDTTAERQGRLTLNPIAHLDVMGMLMVILVGFGYAKPVPTDPRNFRHRSSELWIAAAGPLMNGLLTLVTWNLYVLAYQAGWQDPGMQLFFGILASVNLLLMIFNLIPIGPLDGHYILPYFLPRPLARFYRTYNHRYGTLILLGLIIAIVAGLPIQGALAEFNQTLLRLITLV